MKRDLAKLPRLKSSFLSCEKDMETILKRLFVESQPYSNQLKRLLVVNAKDCLDNEEYSKIVDGMTLAKIREEGYLLWEPKLRMFEHDEVKSYLVIEFDNFTPNPNNPEFRDCYINFIIVCHIDCWDLGNYRTRPFKIAGIIDGLLNDTKLSGIGTLQFESCEGLVLDENLSSYILSYKAIHMTDDRLEEEE